MSLIPQAVMQFVDVDGDPYAFAKAYFYETLTNTPIVVWADAELTITQSNPVVADDAGIFPPIYLDDLALYRMLVKSSDDVDTITDVDPVNQLLSITADDIADGAIEEKLGYTPVNPALAVFTAPARLTFDPASPVEIFPDEVGYRGAPQFILDLDTTLILDHSGGLLTHDDAASHTWTIPPNVDVAFPVGHHMWISVTNTGHVTLARGAAVALRSAGDGTDQDLTLAQNTFALLFQEEADHWVVLGASSAPLSKVIDLSRSVTLADAGCLLVHDDATNWALTIDPFVTTPYPVGFEFEVAVLSTGQTTVTRGAAVHLRASGDATDQNQVLSQWGIHRFRCVAQDIWLMTPNFAT